MSDNVRITQLAESKTGDPVTFDIEIDGEAFASPSWLECAGLRWKAADDGSIDLVLLDTIISYTLAGVRVVVEVSPQDHVDHASLLQLAGNAGFSIAAVPPQPGTHQDIDAWACHCENFTEALLTTPNFSGDLFPVTSFLSYLLAEAFAGASAATPQDPYLRRRFYDPVPEEAMDRVKTAMRIRLHDILGGPGELRRFLAALVAPLRAEAENHMREEIEKSLSDDT